MNIVKIALSTLFLIIALQVSSAPQAIAGETQKKERLSITEKRNKTDRNDDLFEVIFLPPPPLPTERGILVIDAFYDKNKNGLRDKDDFELRNEIICQVGEIEYSVPAFIPGLNYEKSYRVACEGKNYFPKGSNKSIFVKRRGQILRMDIPCDKEET